MKVSWVLWWTFSILVFVSFIGMSIFVWIRKIDGTGAIQTPEIKLVSFIVLLFAFAIPFFFQLIWLLINIVISKKTINQSLKYDIDS